MSILKGAEHSARSLERQGGWMTPERDAGLPASEDGAVSIAPCVARGYGRPAQQRRGRWSRGHRAVRTTMRSIQVSNLGPAVSRATPTAGFTVTARDVVEKNGIQL